MYDYVIAGAGPFGCVFARELAVSGYNILVVEKRNHVGGNCHSYREDGIDVSTYGPHILHTSDANIWNYIEKFVKLKPFINSPKAFYKGKLFSLPINLNTIYEIYGTTTPDEALKKLASVVDKNDDPKNLEEWMLSKVGPDIYYFLIRGYTKKQWGCDPINLPASIVKRIPIRYTFDNNYFDDPYQGIPSEGYEVLFQRILDHENITTILDTDFIQDKKVLEKISRRTLFTGKMDDYYEYAYGPLKWRSLRFEVEKLNMENFQGNAVINYTDEEIPYTRIVEYKHFTKVKSEKTIIAREYPEDWSIGKEAYYPVKDIGDGSKIYEQYCQLAKKDYLRVQFKGRLAEYTYRDTCPTFAEAIKFSNEVLKNI